MDRLLPLRPATTKSNETVEPTFSSLLLLCLVFVALVAIVAHVADVLFYQKRRQQVTMKGVSHDVEGLEFRVGDGDACRINLVILDGHMLIVIDFCSKQPTSLPSRRGNGLSFPCGPCNKFDARPLHFAHR